jgi:hypothetical protein
LAERRGADNPARRIDASNGRPMVGDLCDARERGENASIFAEPTPARGLQ